METQIQLMSLCHASEGWRRKEYIKYVTRVLFDRVEGLLVQKPRVGGRWNELTITENAV